MQKSIKIDAWLGMIDFLVPLVFALVGGNKHFCNKYCGRGQLLNVLGKNGRCSLGRPAPKWMASKGFRYGFLIFFLTMFGNILFQTWLVASGARSLREVIKLFWTIRVPWGWTYTAGIVQTKDLVFFLPHGYDDTRYLQIKSERVG